MIKKRGRPGAEGKKHAITCYLSEDQHERLRLGAQIAGKPLTAIVEQLVAEWLERNERAIDAARKVLGPDKLSL